MMGANQTCELHNISTFWFFVSHSFLSNATEISTNTVNIITNLVTSSYYLLMNYIRKFENGSMHHTDVQALKKKKKKITVEFNNIIY